MHPAPVPSRSEPNFAEPKLCVKLIPALSLASSKRIVDFAVTLAGAAVPVVALGLPVCAAAKHPTSNHKRSARRNILIAPPRQLLRSTRQINRCRGTQQHLRNAVLRRALRPCVATDAIALLALTNPEPALLLPLNLAFCVQQGEANRAIRRRFDEKRSIPLDRCRSNRDRAPRRVLRLQPYRRRH